MSRKTRWSWYLLIGMIATTSAEALSGSTPIIFPTGVLVLLIYSLHYLLIFDFLAARNAITLRALAVGGVVLGFTTESLITKVIWNPPWDNGETVHILGLGLYEVGFIVMVWHAWMSLAIPFALTLTSFGYAEILSPRQARRILLLLPLTLVFVASIGNLPPLMVVPVVLLNGLGILLSAWLFQRQDRRYPLFNINQMRLTRGERRLVWVLILILYVLMLPVRREAYPAFGPFMLGMFLMGGSMILLAAVRRADANKTPLPGEIRYRPRSFMRYMVYFLLTGLPLAVLSSLAAPVFGVVAILSALVIILIGNGYMLRLARRTLPRLWRSDPLPTLDTSRLPG